jgi:hypothetical protein
MTNNVRDKLLLGMAASVLICSYAGQAAASCISPPLSEQSLADFRQAPQRLVASNADTRSIEGTVRDLAGTDASIAAELVLLAKGTSPRFQVAIAAGLAQAATACTTQDPKAAQAIQEAVAGFDDGQFQAAFAAVVGDISTAATVAAAAASESSVGSVVSTNSNRSPSSPRSFGGGAISSLIQLSSPGSVQNGTTTANTTGLSATAAGVVSPTR